MSPQLVYIYYMPATAGDNVTFMHGRFPHSLTTSTDAKLSTQHQIYGCTQHSGSNFSSSGCQKHLKMSNEKLSGHNLWHNDALHCLTTCTPILLVAQSHSLCTVQPQQQVQQRITNRLQTACCHATNDHISHHHDAQSKYTNMWCQVSYIMHRIPTCSCHC